jgi:hypothetical protein
LGINLTKTWMPCTLKMTRHHEKKLKNI